MIVKNLVNILRSLIKTDNRRRLLVNFTSLIILRGFQFLIPLVTLPYLVRTIGIEKFGLVNFALSLGLYFGAVIQFGFSITATRDIARHREDPIKLAQIYSATLSASVLLAVISAVIFTLIVLLVQKFSTYLNLYLFTLAFIVFQNLFPIWFFQGIEKMKYITFLSLGTSSIYLVALFMLVKEQNDFVLVPLIHAMAALVTFLLAIIVIHKQFKIRYNLPKWIEVNTVYREGHHAFISQLAPNLYNNSAVFLLGLFANNTVVGLYTAALRVIEVMMALGQILSSTFFPLLSRNLSKHHVFLKLMIIVGLILTASAMFLSEVITVFLYGRKNLEVSTYIAMLSPWIILIFIRNALGVNYLMLTGYERQYKNILLYSSIFSFCLALVLVPYMNIMGAIIVINISAILMTLLTFALYSRVKKRKS